MLSGPRLLLLALALGMCVLGLVMDPPILFSFVFVSFVHPPGGFLVSFVFALSFGFVISLCLILSPLGLRAWEGVAGGLGSPRGNFTAVHVVEDFLCYLVLCFITVSHWVIGRPPNGSCWSLLELFLWCFLGFLVLVLPMIYSA